MITAVFIFDLAALVGMIIGTIICDRPQHGRHRYNRRSR